MATLRKSANPIKSSLKSVASNKWMKKADAKWTYDKAVEDYRKKVQKRWTASVKQQLWGSMWQNELYWAKEWANKAEKRVKQLEKYNTRTKVNNKDLSKSLWSVANNRWMKKSDVKWTVKLAEKKLSAAEQNLKKISNTKVRTSAWQSTIWKSRAYELSREDNKRYNDAQKAVSMAKKNLKSLNKTASRRK